MVSQSATVGKELGHNAYIAVWSSLIFQYEARLLLRNGLSELQRFPLRLLSAAVGTGVTCLSKDRNRGSLLATASPL